MRLETSDDDKTTELYIMGVSERPPDTVRTMVVVVVVIVVGKRARFSWYPAGHTQENNGHRNRFMGSTCSPRRNQISSVIIPLITRGGIIYCAVVLCHLALGI